MTKMVKKMTVNTSGDEKTTSVLKAAWIIAVVTIISKLIGFIRDIVMELRLYPMHTITHIKSLRCL